MPATATAQAPVQRRIGRNQVHPLILTFLYFSSFDLVAQGCLIRHLFLLLQHHLPFHFLVGEILVVNAGEPGKDGVGHHEAQRRGDGSTACG